MLKHFKLTQEDIKKENIIDEIKNRHLTMKGGMKNFQNLIYP